VFLGPEIEGMELWQAAEVLGNLHCPRCGGTSRQLFLTEDEITEEMQPRPQRQASENGDDIVDVQQGGSTNDGDSW
jgi:hypothetical protein